MPLSTIGTNQIADGAVAVADIADGSVTTAKIADDAVTSAKVDTNIAIGGTLGVTGIGTFTDDIVIGDGKTIGSASKTDAITIASSGLTQLRSTGISAGNQVFQVIDDGATLFQLRSEDGNISFPQAGAGIYLGVTSGTASNLLDDYEEGTFTAEVRGASARASTPVTGQAHYTKVGNKVTVRMYFVNVNTTGASGTFQVTGFPFSATSLQIIPFMSFGQDYDDSGGVMNVQLYLEGGTTAQLIATKDNSAWQTTGITAGSGKYYAFTGTYLTS